ncbi:Neurexin-3 [Nymphon striatum]|nr:Neurexin-3 [Nymphon striatum]
MAAGYKNRISIISVVLSMIIILQHSEVNGFTLEGSQTSYAQFRKWFVGVNGSLSLDFKTSEPNGLLLYTDDGGSFDFFEVKLVDGSVRLRYNVGGGATVLTLGRNLNDNMWHRVDIHRKYNETRLVIDGEFQNKVVRGEDQSFGNFSTNGYVYIGGLPTWFNSKLTFLALPSVVFEPRFRGEIRNVAYRSEEAGTATRQYMIEFKGVRSTESDQCDKQDPCQNGGTCISTDNGAICDCKNIDYEGAFCQNSKAPSEATFRGSEYLSYQLTKSGGEAIVSSTETISLYFKTRNSDGLLFYTGDGEDFLNLAVKDGGVIVTMSLGPGTQEKTVKPSRVRFDDNQWHKITVHRKIQELSINVDGVYMQRGSAAGSFSLLASSVMYVGGSDQTSSLPGSRVRGNFKGCLRKVQFTADSLSLNVLELARAGNNLIEKHGTINFQCQEVEAADPITFTTRESFLVLPSWEATRSGSLSFKMRTNEGNGLLMYNAGASKSVSDFFAFELMNGHVYLLMNLGSGVKKVKATSRRVDDGHWHTVSLRRHNKSGRVTVDELATDFNTPGNSNQLDLKGELYLGGIGTSIDAIPIPSELWSGYLGYGYVGCIRDLVVNGEALDIAEYAKKQDSGSIRPACHSLPPQCDSQPCTNNGKCKEGWNRFMCDCTATEFTGPVCAKYATTLSFDGSQHMKIELPKDSKTQAEDITLRLKSNRPNGILLTTYTDKSADRLQLSMDTGRITLSINVGDGYKMLVSGQGLNDNQWHTIHVARRGQNVLLKVDNEPQQHGKFFFKIYVSSVLRPASWEYIHTQTHFSDEIAGIHLTLNWQTVFVGSASQIRSNLGHHQPLPNFIGLMQQLIFNGRHYFELARNGQISNFEVTAKFGKKEQTVHHPVTFKTKLSYVGLPQLKAYSSMNLYFQFKTLEANGLIMYHAGKGQDFLAIELVNGHLHYIFNIGDGSRRVRSNTRNNVNDNHWHAVTIGRPSLRQHSLMVDDMIATVTSTGSNIHLDLDGVLYLGGVPEDMFSTHNLPRAIKSTYGFEGCMGSLDLNGDTPDPILDAVVPNEDVISGCAGPSTKCTNSACSNKGVCIQFWNKYSCDCDMTSYTGPRCADESIAYQFGRAGGLITYTYPSNNRPDSKTDLLALGIMTYSENSIIARIDSSSSNDYLEMEIVEGNIFVVYNMGTDDHPIHDLNIKINDGRYHVIRFTRSGPNSTLKIDEHPVKIKNPKGQPLNVFNSQSKIQIGGKKNSIKGTVDRPYHGIIAGFVFNNQRILDKASEDDSANKLSGDVQLLISIPFDSPQAYRSSNYQMMKQNPALNSGIDDDLVFSGGGSACADDEDNCLFINSGSGDDLITPVYIPAPKSKTTTSRPYIKPMSGNKPCSEDDEDCIDSGASGFEEIAVPPRKSTPRPLSEIRHTPKKSNYVPPLPPSTVTSIIIQPTKPYDIPAPDNEYFPSESSENSNVGIIEPTDIFTNYGPKEDIIKPFRPPIDHGVNRDFNERESRGKKRKPKSRSAETLTLIVGIVASVMIAVVIIAFLVYRFRNRPEGTYKVDEGKNYRFGVDPAPLPNSASGYINDYQAQFNGAVRTAEKAGKLPKKKDIKEWYV